MRIFTSSYIAIALLQIIFCSSVYTHSVKMTKKNGAKSLTTQKLSVSKTGHQGAYHYLMVYVTKTRTSKGTVIHKFHHSKVKRTNLLKKHGQVVVKNLHKLVTKSMIKNGKEAAQKIRKSWKYLKNIKTKAYERSKKAKNLVTKSMIKNGKEAAKKIRKSWKYLKNIKTKAYERSKKAKNLVTKIMIKLGKLTAQKIRKSWKYLKNIKTNSKGNSLAEQHEELKKKKELLR